MAERNQRLKRYRDGLGTTINRAVDFVQGASEVQQLNPGDTLTQSPIGLGQPSQVTTPPAATQSLESHMQLLQPNNACGLGSETFDFPGPDLFEDLQDLPIDLPMNLQNSLSRDNAQIMHPFGGVFAEDFWVGDDLPTLDGFEGQS